MARTSGPATVSSASARPAPAVTSDSVPAAPTPRRLSRPKWLDPRIVVGLLLVIAAVVVGAKVIGSSRQTIPIWAAAHDLAAGTVVTDADLVRAEVNLGDSVAGYLSADTTAGGRVLNRQVTAGELLPSAALAASPDGGRLLGIGIEASDMPPGVTHGSVIDLYLMPMTTGAVAARGNAELVAKEVTVQSVTAPSSGGLSGASSSKYQVVLLMDVKSADGLVRKLPSGSPLILLIPQR
jgi:hypothetical protein